MLDVFSDQVEPRYNMRALAMAEFFSGMTASGAIDVYDVHNNRDEILVDNDREKVVRTHKGISLELIRKISPKHEPDEISFRTSYLVRRADGYNNPSYVLNLSQNRRSGGILHSTVVHKLGEFDVERDLRSLRVGSGFGINQQSSSEGLYVPESMKTSSMMMYLMENQVTGTNPVLSNAKIKFKGEMDDLFQNVYDFSAEK